jgi:hypothetical protein
MLVRSLHTRGLTGPFCVSRKGPEAVSPDALKVGAPLRQNLMDLSNDFTGMRQPLLDLSQQFAVRSLS